MALQFIRQHSGVGQYNNAALFWLWFCL